MNLVGIVKSIFGRSTTSDGNVPAGVARETPDPGHEFRFRVGSATSIGNVRDNNEDRFYTDLNRRLFIVADGMGGQNAGEQASQLAVDIIPMRLNQINSNSITEKQLQEMLAQGVLAANEQIMVEGASDPSRNNMGTTVVLCQIYHGVAYYAHIGDSRAYHYRDGNEVFITTDHNLAEALYKAGTIKAEDVPKHRFRHVLYKYLGSNEAKSSGPDIMAVPLVSGDRIILASDGLTGHITNETLRQEIYRRNNPQQTAEELIRMSLENGSQDNVTCVVIFVE